ncbi:31-O-demethyl-FK506 methyltransferase FkbM [Rosistilla carotiformis]|uniref:31-O-demethyl-FK506 methyltransferase FkbM n=1 Tax=Rosistilla carotiformis TaxID=2528017 RepID=A0A518JQY7_9BACT|nr:FkbM family methyltransferase [Rosistilla carotiformis]QDV67959.1 31-O-demethyl-FK506 methyltransferase FkbM [Rosistilla carotiformis]
MTRFRGYRLHYTDLQAMESMCREADEFPAFFTPPSDDALFIDCGANIGVMMLECKRRWPQAKIVCFEPDPFAFAALQRNVDVNDLPGVRCIEAAVSDREGQATFYGALAATADGRGNSLNAGWAQRPGSTTQTVACRQLSKVIGDRQVDFLKLDIEGSEEAVLGEITDQLPQIQAIYVEVHETPATLAENSVEAITQQLNAAGFTVDAQQRAYEFALPPHLAQWQAAARPTQTQLLCWR